MPRTKTTLKTLSHQVKNPPKLKTSKKGYDGNTETMVSTGSTLLDLALSGGRVRGGGLPGGIFVEIFGPESAGKTVMLCEIAGAVQRAGGKVMFQDPEARLNTQFAQIFDFNIKTVDHSTPDTVVEVFRSIREWMPEKKKGIINGCFTDSLAALSTELEMENKDGDKMGMKRAKDFSAELRKTCREITKENLLLVASNQIRETGNTYGPATDSPGGRALKFYASVRIKANRPETIKIKKATKGKDVTRIIGVTTEFVIVKSSIWKPMRSAPVTILFDYGIDDVRQNLQFIKDHTPASTYTAAGVKLGTGLEQAILKVEEKGLEKKLKEQVIDLWMEIESKFETSRKKKIR